MFVAREERDIEEVGAQIVWLEFQTRSRMADWLALVEEFDRREGWRGTRFSGTARWLADRCRLSTRTARDHVRVAKRLAVWPAVAEAFGLGQLSYSQVRALSRADEGEDELALLRIARSSSTAELERHVAQLRSAPSADPDIARRTHAKRFLKWFFEEDGSLAFFGRLAADAGQAFVEAIEEGRERLDAEPALWRDAGPRPPMGARRADALTEIALSGAPKTQLMLHADLPSLRGLADGEVLHLDAGPSIPPALAQRLTCDCEITLKGLNLGRTTRVVTPTQRRALEQRDGRVCSMPGCTRVHDLHAHHLRHWSNGGATDLDNLALFCHFHHRLFHDDGWTVERRGDGTLRIADPRGRELQAVPPRASPTLLLAA